MHVYFEFNGIKDNIMEWINDMIYQNKIGCLVVLRKKRVLVGMSPFLNGLLFINEEDDRNLYQTFLFVAYY